MKLLTARQAQYIADKYIARPKPVQIWVYRKIRAAAKKGYKSIAIKSSKVNESTKKDLVNKGFVYTETSNTIEHRGYLTIYWV